MDYIREVQQQVTLREGVGVLEKLLSYVYFYGPLPTKELARKCLLPIPVTSAIKKEFIKLGVLEQRNGVQLTAEGLRFFEHELGYLGIDRALYLRWMSSSDEREAEITRLSKTYRELFDSRPNVDVTIDQAKGTAETAFRRAFLCLENDALIGKRILCVGDDDLISVALSLVLQRLFPNSRTFSTEISVFDVDERYISYISSISQENSFPIHAISMNLLDPLPLRYANYFDCFFTDPPYTLPGVSLFLSRGINALKKEKGLKIFLSYGQKPNAETLVLQQTIVSHGLAILQLLPAFNFYEGATSLGNTSQMLVLETTNETKSMIPTERLFDESIYTRQLKAPATHYKCKKCRAEFSVGKSGAFCTIEQLKEAGCPNCGGHIFLQERKKPLPTRRNLISDRALGTHILADFFQCDPSVLRDPKAVEAHMHEAAKRAKATIISEEFHTFNPFGVSGVILIQESHLTIHTWPEYSYAAVDLFTCGHTLELWDALEYLKECFGCSHFELNDVERGEKNKL